LIAVDGQSKASAGQGMRDNMMLSRNRDLLEAEQLQDLWCSLSLRHVSLEGGRCSCGREHVTLRLTDFEEDIGEYLYDDAARAQRQDINAFLRAHGRDAETGLWNIERLVRLLASAEPELGLTVEVRAALVAKLRPIIESFDRLHV
jgi:hypothetical protein